MGIQDKYTVQEAVVYAKAQGIGIPYKTVQAAFYSGRKLDVSKRAPRLQVCTGETLDVWVRRKIELRDLAAGKLLPEHTKFVSLRHAKRLSKLVT